MTYPLAGVGPFRFTVIAVDVALYDTTKRLSCPVGTRTERKICDGAAVKEYVDISIVTLDSPLDTDVLPL